MFLDLAAPKIQKYGIINETAAMEGNDVTLYCAAEGYPYLSYKWTKKNGKRELATGQRLSFLRVRPEDDGVYVCTAFNTEGSAKLLIQLHVYSKFVVFLITLKMQTQENSRKGRK